MTTRRFHALGPNQGKSFPRNWVFVDTESHIEVLPNGGEKHTLRLGVAVYVRDGRANNPARETWWGFDKATEFWGKAIACCEQNRRLCIVGYNIGYDFRTLSGFKVLTGLGYTPIRLYLSSFCTILQFTKGKHIILILDAQNYFRGSLERWGELMGMKKVPVDFYNVSDDRLREHCWRDVEILQKLWGNWRSFVTENDLGHFCVTIPSQAMTAFRHRFMPCEVYIHNNEEATEIERESYVGGRVECWHVGVMLDGPFYKVDVTSMYPAMMNKFPVPVKLLGVWRDPTIELVIDAIKEHAVVGEVLIDTDKPIYSVRHEGVLLWPTGQFWTTLTGPEIELALWHGHILEFGRVCVYKRAVLFAKYVEAMFALRQQFQEDHNEVWSEMVKRLLNTLYGKFGQRSEQWEYQGYNKNLEDGMITVYDGITGESYKVYQVCGHAHAVIGWEEAFNSFPAIASYITSYARCYLWELIVTAGMENVLYMDTDSLILRQAGFDRLQSYIQPGVLGKLKLEYVTQSLKIDAPKEYYTDKEEKCKGVRSSAKHVTETRWDDMKWESMRGALRTGRIDHVHIDPITKNLLHFYNKGVVHSSGAVTPLVLAAVNASS